MGVMQETYINGILKAAPPRTVVEVLCTVRPALHSPTRVHLRRESSVCLENLLSECSLIYTMRSTIVRRQRTACVPVRRPLDCVCIFGRLSHSLEFYTKD